MDWIPDYQNITAAIEAVFKLIFPEFPQVGVVVIALTLILFLIYFMKADIRQALKISLVSLGIMVFILYFLHSMDKLFFAVV